MSSTPALAAGAAPALGDLPDGWRLEETTGPLGFVTHARLTSPGGGDFEWTSRRHRKGLGLRSSGRPVVEAGQVRRRPPPSRMSMALGSLFGIGSICFALGSLPWYFNAVPSRTVGITFFVGSIFFTSAAYLAYHEVLAAPEGIRRDSPRPSRIRAIVGWTPRRLDWWSTVVQFAGTLMFNVSTFAAISPSPDPTRVRNLIWAPDVGGSICFLVASWLAYSEVNRGVLPRSDRSTGWRIAALNMLGSIAFGVSAVAARYPGTNEEVANPSLVNLGTFSGAICFLAGAALLPVESSLDNDAALAGAEVPDGPSSDSMASPTPDRKVRP